MQSAADGTCMPEKSQVERRVRERIPVSWDARLVFDGGNEACRVMDFSPRGARITACNDAPINHRISLRLTEHGEFVGRIVWRRPDSMGIKFQHLEDAHLTRRDETAIRFIA